MTVTKIALKKTAFWCSLFRNKRMIKAPASMLIKHQCIVSRPKMNFARKMIGALNTSKGCAFVLNNFFFFRT